MRCTAHGTGEVSAGHARFAPGAIRERSTTTEIKTIARGASFFGALLLLYTVASGLWLDSTTEAVSAAAVQQHSIVGMIGTGLCIAGVALLLRLKP